MMNKVWNNISREQSSGTKQFHLINYIHTLCPEKPISDTYNACNSLFIFVSFHFFFPFLMRSTFLLLLVGYHKKYFYLRFWYIFVLVITTIKKKKKTQVLSKKNNPCKSNETVKPNLYGIVGNLNLLFIYRLVKVI